MKKEPRTLEDKLTFLIDFISLPTYEELKAFDAYLTNSFALPLAKRLNKWEFITLFRFSKVQESKNILCKDCTLKTNMKIEKVKQ